MNSKAFVELVEKELKAQKISKATFYAATGISSASFSQWRNGIYSPSSANIKSVEDFLGVNFHLSTKKEPALLSESELSEAKKLFMEKVLEMDDSLVLSLNDLADKILSRQEK